MAKFRMVFTAEYETNSLEETNLLDQKVAERAGGLLPKARNIKCKSICVDTKPSGPTTPKPSNPKPSGPTHQEEMFNKVCDILTEALS